MYRCLRTYRLYIGPKVPPNTTVISRNDSKCKSSISNLILLNTYTKFCNSLSLITTTYTIYLATNLVFFSLSFFISLAGFFTSSLNCCTTIYMCTYQFHLVPIIGCYIYIYIWGYSHLLFYLVAYLLQYCISQLYGVWERWRDRRGVLEAKRNHCNHYIM